MMIRRYASSRGISRVTQSPIQIVPIDFADKLLETHCWRHAGKTRKRRSGFAKPFPRIPCGVLLPIAREAHGRNCCEPILLRHSTAWPRPWLPRDCEGLRGIARDCETPNPDQDPHFHHRVSRETYRKKGLGNKPLQLRLKGRSQVMGFRGDCLGPVWQSFSTPLAS